MYLSRERDTGRYGFSFGGLPPARAFLMAAIFLK
jgi:hypothetical protein